MNEIKIIASNPRFTHGDGDTNFFANVLLNFDGMQYNLNVWTDGDKKYFIEKLPSWLILAVDGIEQSILNELKKFK